MVKNNTKPERKNLKKLAEGEFKKCLSCKKALTTVQKIHFLAGRSTGRYCSTQCQGDHLWEEKKAKVLKYGIEILNLQSNQSQDRILKLIIIEEFGKGKSGRACWHCGWEKENPFTKKGGIGSKRNSRFISNIPTQMNHIDGNPNNQSIENLEIVCPNCHALGPYYGSRGKGGRTDARGNAKSR